MSDRSSTQASEQGFTPVDLGEIAHIEMGQSPDSRYVFEDPFLGYPFLQGNAEFGAVYPEPKYGCTRPAKTAKSGDVLISVRAPVGAINIADQSYCIGRGLAAIRISGIEPSLAALLITGQAAALRRVAQGTTFEAISKKDLVTLTLRIPPQDELPAIAQILNTLDTVIRETEVMIDKLKALKQGLLHDLLTRGIDANGQLRPPQSKAPQLYKESQLGWIPSEWEVLLLDTVATRGSGHTPSKDVLSYWNGGVKWVSLADSHRLDQIYIHETDKEISELGIANSSAVLHSEGTVILSRDAGIGKSAILGCNMAVSQHFMAWRCGEKLNNLFLYFYLQREKPKFEAIAMGSTIKTIGLPFFKSYEIALPPRGEQDQAATILMETEQHLAAHDAELEKLRQQKISLMDDLLTGRVRVTPLLESIQKVAAPTEA
jgi:type I restriction enzyme S subunit